jgi:DNA repair protein RecO (recombination protein O)
VLSRTDYGEADRIITVLTPDQGKLRLMAKGVRRIKSKLAGGIELFSVSDLTFIQGKGDIRTLISSRLQTHYGNIVKSIDRTQAGYDMISRLHKATEDNPESTYFELLRRVFEGLDDTSIDLDLVRIWFELQLLRLAGNTPNLKTDAEGAALTAGGRYNFDFDAMAFAPHTEGPFQATHIKALRLLTSDNSPVELKKVQGLDVIVSDIQPLVRSLLANYI